MGVAFSVLILATHTYRAGDFTAYIREGETAFFVNIFTWVDDRDFRICQCHRHNQIKWRLLAVEAIIELGLFAFGRAHVHYAELQCEANLLRGQADAVFVIHGVDHVVGELRERVIKFCNRVADFA